MQYFYKVFVITQCVFKSIIKTILFNSAMYKDNTKAVESCV